MSNLKQSGPVKKYINSFNNQGGPVQARQPQDPKGEAGKALSVRERLCRSREAKAKQGEASSKGQPEIGDRKT